MSGQGKKLRCAIYTRKSTEEGLEQEFNSLDAQREACRAYVMSQAHEGWILDDTIYDDGGYSGGNLNRPALTALLEEVKQSRIDIIVVYKIDRLTRSLSDFAKIIDVMDEANASFVSITQAFNTTTSMGRLTLNVLLSFAQFEREVTGERIRDKIAASKKKGMWMGGPVPLGYRLQDRKLMIDEAEAKTVRLIFRTYLDAGSMTAAVEHLAKLNVRSKVRRYKSGKCVGGTPLRRGGLQHLLRNPVYRGEISHKGKLWPGEHEALIDDELWSAVQAKLDTNDNDGRSGARAGSLSLLAGLLVDEHGRKLSPSHATKGTRRYRYYVTARDEPCSAEQPAIRVPAHDLEKLVIKNLREHLADPAKCIDDDATKVDAAMVRATTLAEQLRSETENEVQRALRNLVGKIIVRRNGVTLRLKPSSEDNASVPEIHLPAVRVRAGGEIKLVVQNGEGAASIIDEKLAFLLADAWDVRERVVAGASMETLAAERDCTKQWIGKLLRLGWLPPQLVEAVISGKKPGNITRRKLSQKAMQSLLWGEQMQELASF